jgi:FkbM family methyltransferase
MLAAVIATFGICRIRPHESAVSMCHYLDSQVTKGRLRSDTLFVDVGAARAYQTQVARAYGFPVLAFECRSDEVERLRAAFAGDSHVTLRPVCLGEQPGHATLHRAGDSSSLHSENVAHGKELRKARGETARTEVVNISTLDLELTEERLHALGVSSVGILKVDTQGHEAEVLAGAVEMVKRDKPFLFYENMFHGSEDAWRRTKTNYSCFQFGNDCMCSAKGAKSSNSAGRGVERSPDASPPQASVSPPPPESTGEASSAAAAASSATSEEPGSWPASPPSPAGSDPTANPTARSAALWETFHARLAAFRARDPRHQDACVRAMNGTEKAFASQYGQDLFVWQNLFAHRAHDDGKPGFYKGFYVESGVSLCTAPTHDQCRGRCCCCCCCCCRGRCC